jgi:NAD(P)-dependent dehydrogenase (short-subunit alcohol dehydrogenase family)
VTCNALAPGFVVTPLTEQAVNTIPGFAERHAAASMVGRNGLPEDFRRSHLSRVRRQCLCDGAHTVCRWWLRRQVSATWPAGCLTRRGDASFQAYSFAHKPTIYLGFALHSMRSRLHPISSFMPT